MKNRNVTVDLSKYIASLMVIAIHCDLFYDINTRLNFFTVNILCRLAVPFFAMCTGYFLSSKLSFNDKLDKTKKNKQIVLKQWKKLFVLYIVWSFLYCIFSIPNWISTGLFSKRAFIDYGIGAVLHRSYYHLWYLLGILYALPLLYLILRKIKVEFYLLVSGILYFIMVLSYGYRLWLPNAIQKIFSYMDYYSGIVNAIILLIPFMLLGVYIRRTVKSQNKNSILLGFVLSFLMLICEATVLYIKGQSKFSYIIFTLPAAYFLFKLIVNSKFEFQKFNSAYLGSCSLFIYCVHPMILEIFNFVNNSILKFVIACMISTALGVLYTIVKQKIKLVK